MQLLITYNLAGANGRGNKKPATNWLADYLGNEARDEDVVGELLIASQGNRVFLYVYVRGVITCMALFCEI